jgi:diaminohydroxyphosphoribosylaminopyrimidine deaminase/5-amino-6-(5-phosphoribosylamino)uracil reductase
MPMPEECGVPTMDDRRRLGEAIELSRRCPPKASAFSVGAVIVGVDGVELARGFSRETDEHVHAEESALSKLDADARVRSATIYSSLEPCSIRKSRPSTCTRLILAAGIRRVVFAWREPDLFVADCRGAEILAQEGVEIVEISDMAALARRVNVHLPLAGG